MTIDPPLISFDYAIKYLLRDKKDYEIVEGFLSILLQTQGYGAVKIISLLESESNKEGSKAKRSIADLVVEDENKKKYIIEVERNEKYSFIQKACFNTSRLIVDNLSVQQDYTDIVKVFHISLLYFPIREMMPLSDLCPTAKMDHPKKTALYHGKTLFHDVYEGQPVHIHLKDPKTNRVYNTTDIFPEYFFISVPEFNDIIQGEIDEWLWMMKYNEVLDTFKSRYMEKIKEKLKVLNMSNEERCNYFLYLKKLIDDKEELKTAIAKGEERGREEGREEGRAEGLAMGMAMGMEKANQEFAIKLKEMGKSAEEILTLTGVRL